MKLSDAHYEVINSFPFMDKIANCKVGDILGYDYFRYYLDGEYRTFYFIHYPYIFKKLTKRELNSLLKNGKQIIK